MNRPPERTEGRSAPQYTREALEARVQGLMIVKCVVQLSGKLENCRIIKPLPHMDEIMAIATGSPMERSIAQASAWLIRQTEGFAHALVLLKEARNIKYADFVS